MWKDLKYLLAYIIPAVVAHALYYKGIWSYNGITVAFVIVPILESFLTGTTKNLNDEEELNQNKKFLFDFLLILNAPILFFLLFWYFNSIQAGGLQMYEYVGLTLTIGMYIGAVGINVAHELGHRTDRFSQWVSKLLLIPNLYMHFFIEHNRGHHVHIATPKDPASSRKNENIYAFYVRSVSLGFISAWQLEKERLLRANKAVISIYNQMIRFQVVQLCWLALIVYLYGWFMLPVSILVSILGFLMLETVNYIEHYGLQRRMMESGRYEPVQPWHSWNCNHDIGRILLYELTRHSDHHYKSTRKYQVLRHFDKAPQLPWGYPTSMLIALLPPLWFYLMNPVVEQYKSEIPELSH